jgi:hypothetical protein
MICNPVDPHCENEEILRYITSILISACGKRQVLAKMLTIGRYITQNMNGIAEQR